MLNILWGLIQFLWVWFIGVYLLKFLPVHIPKRYRLPVAFLFGESVISLFLLVMGLCAQLNPSIILPIVSITGFFTAMSFWQEIQPNLKRLPNIVKDSPFSMALFVVLMIPYLLGVCVPEREIDSIWYHLYVPQFYLIHGGAIQKVPFNLPSHYPMYAHLHYVITLMLGNDTSAKTFTLLHFIPLLMGLAAGVRRYAGKQWMVPACVFMLACVHYKLPVMSNIYRPLQLSLLLSTLLLLYSYESGRRSSFYLAAFFCGMAIGTKYPAIFFVFAAHITLMIFRWALRKRTSTFVLVQSIAVYSLIAWALASPWLIKSYIYTGNPFFPGLSGFFSVKPEYQSVAETYTHIHSLAPLKANGLLD
ncbi:glycosyltransferase family 39 protein, partial [bacterium]|nr:glycosyltransferase family 39 protein [bacterium]